MNLTDILSTGSVVSIIGLGTVFAVLALLWGVLEIMRMAFSPKTKDKNAAKEEAVTPISEETTSSAEGLEDEEELIAVLTAAVAASLNTSTYKLRIQSYRQIGSKAPVWNSVSRRENLQ